MPESFSSCGWYFFSLLFYSSFWKGKIIFWNSEMKNWLLKSCLESTYGMIYFWWKFDCTYIFLIFVTTGIFRKLKFINLVLRQEAFVSFRQVWLTYDLIILLVELFFEYTFFFCFQVMQLLLKIENWIVITIIRELLLLAVFLVLIFHHHKILNYICDEGQFLTYISLN